MKKLWKFIIGAAVCLSALSATPACALPVFQNRDFTGFFHWQHSGAGNAQGSPTGFAVTVGQTGTVKQQVAGFILTHSYSLKANAHGSGQVNLFYNGAFHGIVVHGASSSIAKKFVPTATKETFGAQLRETGLGSVGVVNFNFVDDGPSPSGAASGSVPEVDPGAAVAPLALALGGLLLMSERRAKSI